MEITEDDLIWVAKIMGKDFSDEERRHVIRFLECGDIQACPGSGKTTAMVAKLLIMAEKLVGTLAGICALSHTNAAKDEIRKSFGNHSYLLLRYPHFVGTIQSFVDQFLAIPAYIEEYGHRPVAIDDELYENVASRYFYRLNRGTQYALDRQNNNAGKEVFCDTSYGYADFMLVKFDGNQETTYFCSSKTPTYQDILRCKQEITALGYLTYHDAFAYANRYLTKYPEHAKTIAKRFSFVFIDEMQDTDAYQNELIERLFRDRSTIQRFGDPYQTIYGHKSQRAEPVWLPEQNHAILSSRRLSRSISRLSQGICSESFEIQGNDEIPSHPHTIILFDQKSIQNVIPRFGQIIGQESLLDGPFKAIGAVGKLHSNPNNLSIASYWPNFQRKQTFNRANDPFWGTISQAHATIRLKGYYSEAYPLLIKAFIEILRICHFKTANGNLYTSAALIRTIRESGENNLAQFQLFLLTVCENLYQSNSVDIDYVINQIHYVFSLLGFVLDAQTEGALRDRGQHAPINQPVNGDDPNIYSHSPNLPIEINTIHSVKGQTHQATLVLETCFFKNDLPMIYPYLVGEKVKRPGSRILYRYLPLIYVACTRPSHLLCLAIQKDHIDDKKQVSLHQYGWEINDLTL